VRVGGMLIGISIDGYGIGGIGIGISISMEGG
jgi:hypothetical protein